MVICNAEDPCFSGTYKSHGVPQFLDGSNGAFLQPPEAGAALRATYGTSFIWGALPPVDLQAVCFVRAMLLSDDTIPLEEHLMPTNSDSCSEKLCRTEIKK